MVLNAILWVNRTGPQWRELSKSIKKVACVSQQTGIDGGKWVNGRKRHIAVDTLDLPWAMVVTAANVSDTQAGYAAAL